MGKQFSGASNSPNMLSIFFAFTLLALTSAQTDEPTSGPTQKLISEPSGDWWQKCPASVVKDGFKYEKAPVEHPSISSVGAPLMWKICKEETRDVAIGCLYHNRKSADGDVIAEAELPSEGFTYCIPFAGGSEKCCASDETTSVIVN